jgi:beta-lactamase class A
MCRVVIKPVVSLLVALSALVVLSPTAFAAERYDVSYLWHRDAASVTEYRERVASVLGPDVAKDLVVVAKGKLFGLIYTRRGDSAGATRVARSHSRLLSSRGLEAAAPVRSRDWTLVGSTDVAPAPVRSPSAAVAASAATAPDRVQRIRDLETAVDAYIKRLRREGKIAADERTGWSVYDFTTGEKLVTINEDVQFQAASLVKPFIAAAFFHKVEKGELVYGRKSRRHMQRMIQHSNNPSTNWVARQVGGPRAVERILRRHYPGIFQETRLVEYIPADGRTYRNKASVHDYSRFLYALWQEEIPGAREIKRLMALPGSDRIFTGTREIPKGTEVYNKTGSTARLCGDMGILNVKGRDGKRYPYTLIGVIEKQQRASDYTTWIRSRSDVIRDVSNIVYQGISQHHGLEGVL